MGKIIQGPWAKRSVPTSGELRPLFAAALASMREMMDPRAKCVTCGQPATRDDGMCNGCRRQEMNISKPLVSGQIDDLMV